MQKTDSIKSTTVLSLIETMKSMNKTVFVGLHPAVARTQLTLEAANTFLLHELEFDWQKPSLFCHSVPKETLSPASSTSHEGMSLNFKF